MPGILPMKVIKVGVNAQTRIAQACDRCRSKKIRCDGVRPCCSQCANVGFECKTSDKLSRRAFPRGYTESLEERVRGLECEVRELKELLDEKDEKIDMLSRIHSQSSLPLQLPSPRRPSTNSLDSPSLSRVSSLDKDEVFKVQQSPYLLSDAEGSDSYFAGTSSGRTFIEAFRRKVQESGRSTDIICTEKLLVTNTLRKPAESPLTPEESVGCKAPPRLVSDQLINIFFQEWAPLFPVLHRPTFLALYNRYTADPDSITDKAEVAQLNLVFGIASLSSDARASFDLKSFESQWKAAVDAILGENSMPTLQALVLAQIFCVQQGDLTRLLTYKALSSTLSARLGLHQSQKRFALGTLTCETRKKVFWTLYTVDSFTAVMLGLPKHIMEDDVQCEYPVDTDDENVSEHGFQPSLPGESTKLSSALALFRAARILSKVLVEVFPAKASYDLSFKSLSDLSDELDSWNASLAPHLRLQFAQDKPSTGTISSRSPLLSLAYHYIRALIHRPAVSASIGNRSSSSLIALASSAKHIIQIVELLEERGMCFAFCVNKDELLVLSGFGLMFQGLKLDPTSKLLKDNQKMSRAVVKLLHKFHAPCAIQFDRVLAAFMPSQDTTETSPTLLPTPKPRVPLSRHNSDSAVVITDTTPSPPSSTRKQLKAIASRFTANTKTPQLIPSDGRRATIHNITLHPNGPSTRNQPSLQPTNLFKTAPTSHSEPARSPNILYSRPMSTTSRPSVPPPPTKSRPTKPILSPPQQDRSLNLDYLSFGGEDGAAEVQPPSRSSEPVRTEPQPTDWEKLLGSLDNGTTNIYDACYGGQPIEALLDAPPRSILNSDRPAAELSAGSQSTWNSADIWSLCQTDSDTTVGSVPTGDSRHADSIFSFSSTEDASAGTGSGEGRNSDEFTYADWVSTADASKTASVSGNTSTRGIVMPADDDFTIGGQWENSLVL